MSSPGTRAPGPALVIVPDLEGLARAAARHVRAAAARAIARRGRFRLALSGGSTPRALYRALAADGAGFDWRRTDLFFGDERAVPPDDAASNYRMARETLLEPAGVPPANVRRLRGEDADLDAVARAYEETLRAGAAPPWLDLVLLGLGPDGHTASLFPDSPALDEGQRLCVATGAPTHASPAVRRLTLTYPVLDDADDVLFLVAGADKAAVLREVLAGPAKPRALPAQRVVRRTGPVTIVCDQEAAGELPGSRAMIVLAGDIGGTNSRLALYERDPGAGGESKLVAAKPIFEHIYPSASHRSLDDIVDEFLVAAGSALGGAVGKGNGLAGAAFGIAGPIEHDMCRATNLPWVVDGKALAARIGLPQVVLINDFYAAALGVTAVDASWLAPLGGEPRAPHGPVAVLGAGTGLGQAFLLWSKAENRYEVISSEGGHTDFAPRTPLEAGLMQFLTAKYGRVSCERILSGPGLVDVFSFFSQEPACRPLVRPETRAALADPRPPHSPAAIISERGLAGSDPVCEMSLALFCSVLGAVAGNLALAVLATGGVFVAGGIAPRVLPYLQKGVFREAFDRKGRLHTLVERIPAFVVTHPQIGLLGAASVAVAP